MPSVGVFVRNWHLLLESVQKTDKTMMMYQHILSRLLQTYKWLRSYTGQQRAAQAILVTVGAPIITSTDKRQLMGHQSDKYGIKSWGSMYSSSVGQIRGSIVLRKPCNFLYITYNYMSIDTCNRETRVEKITLWCVLCSERWAQDEGKIESEPLLNLFDGHTHTHMCMHSTLETNTIRLLDTVTVAIT